MMIKELLSAVTVAALAGCASEAPKALSKYATGHAYDNRAAPAYFTGFQRSHGRFITVPLANMDGLERRGIRRANVTGKRDTVINFDSSSGPLSDIVNGNSIFTAYGTFYDFDGNGDEEMFVTLPQQPSEWGIVDFKDGQPFHRDDLAESLYQTALGATENPLMSNFVLTAKLDVGDLTRYRLGENALPSQTITENPDGSVTVEIDASALLRQLKAYASEDKK